jgi:hypothetical protein
MSKVFISYSSKDKEFAQKLIAELEKKEIHTWSDNDLKLGDSIVEKIQENLTNSSAFIVLLSRNYMDSDWSMSEAGMIKALSSSKEKKVFPIIIGNEKLPLYLFSNAHISSSDPTNLDELTKTIKNIIDK